MDRTECLGLMEQGRRGHLATIRPDGRPHVVVITFAMIDGDVVTAVDHKPKSGGPLQRLANVEANPAVSFLVDHYEDDWLRLWWVRIDGQASIHEGGDTHRSAVRALTAKYHQYEKRPPQGPVIVISQERLSSWSYTGSLQPR